MRLVFIILLAFFSVSTAFSEDSEPTTVSVLVSDQCSSDSVGKRVAYYVREGINRSTTMHAVDRYLDSILHVSLVCITPTSGDRGRSSEYSYQVTLKNFEGYYDFSLTHGVGVCGRDRVESCADGLVAATSAELSNLRARIADEKFTWP